MLNWGEIEIEKLNVIIRIIYIIKLSYRSITFVIVHEWMNERLSGKKWMWGRWRTRKSKEFLHLEWYWDNTTQLTKRVQWHTWYHFLMVYVYAPSIHTKLSFNLGYKLCLLDSRHKMASHLYTLFLSRFLLKFIAKCCWCCCFSFSHSGSTGECDYIILTKSFVKITA